MMSGCMKECRRVGRFQYQDRADPVSKQRTHNLYTGHSWANQFMPGHILGLDVAKVSKITWRGFWIMAVACTKSKSLFSGLAAYTGQ
jgi:hypothetical protein